jgi:hypothetical protein
MMENKEIFLQTAARGVAWFLIFAATAVFWIAIGLILVAWLRWPAIG